MRLFKAILPFFIMLCVIGIFHFTNIFWFKYYPSIMNFMIFCIFFISLFQKYTIIKRFVLLREPKAGKQILNYTRNVTYIWAIVTLINFFISFYTVFLSEKVWAIYNGFISYFLVSCVFMIEYCIRLRVIKRENRV